MSIRRPVHKPIKARSLYAKSQILVRKRICIPLNKVQAGIRLLWFLNKNYTGSQRDQVHIYHHNRQQSWMTGSCRPTQSGQLVRVNSAKCPSHLMMQTPAKLLVGVTTTSAQSYIQERRFQTSVSGRSQIVVANLPSP